MGIPSYEQFIWPLLKFLGTQSGPVASGAAYDSVAELAGLSPEEKAQVLPSGRQQVFKNRIGWAQDALKRNGLSSAPRRGHWQITQDGRTFLSRHPKELPQEEVQRLAHTGRHLPVALAVGAQKDTDYVADDESPDERIDNGIREVRARVALELLDLVGKSDPGFFETLVLDLLHAMGYGMSREDLARVGRPGDGGIDGIISQDRLGLEKVYVQAKRWKDGIGSPEVTAFVGALGLKGADKGVLITSGSISKPAWEASRMAKGSVVLIDGERLANLMIDHEVGVTNRVLKLPAVDSDYFEEE